MDFSSADAMLVYLPQSGAPSSLDANLLDRQARPRACSADRWSRSGSTSVSATTGSCRIPPARRSATWSSPTHGLAGRVDGLTVRQVDQVVNAALGGGFEPFAIADLATLVNLMNSSFEGGSPSRSRWSTSSFRQ
jgi:hypothetical protein